MSHAKAPERPSVNGDSIVKDINKKDAGTTDLSDVARSLTDAHAHRPGLYQEDLAKVNEALHNKGILKDVDIVGVRGQDLITRDRGGDHKVHAVDSQDISSSHDVDGGSCKKMGDRGRTVDMNPDGSGKYRVKGGDNDWAIANDMLKSQGIDKPTANQQANYIKEMQKANPGADLNHLKPGAEITLPPVTKAGNDSSFQKDRIDNADTKDKKALADNASAITNELYNQGHTNFSGGYMNRADINNRLQDQTIPADERKTLEFMQTHFDEMKNHGNRGQEWIDKSSVEKWRKAQEEQINSTTSSRYQHMY